MPPHQTLPAAGLQLRQWRERRRLSQLQLALEAEVSTRHLSFIETGRARPGRDTLLRLVDCLEIPLRERNRILLAAGLAPEYDETPLDAPVMADLLEVLGHLLKGHEPYPAIVVDRHWNLVAANDALGLLLEQVDPALLTPPVNVLRLVLHPDGLAPQVVNYAQCRAIILARLDRELALGHDQLLAGLRDELASYTGGANDNDPDGPAPIALPFILDTVIGRLSFITTVTVFGTPRDITLSELALETFLPADAATARALRDHWAAAGGD